MATTQIEFEPGNINSVALGAKTIEGGREVWVLINSRVQRWEMKLEGWEEASQDEDIADLIRTALRKKFGNVVEKDDAKLDLELVDLAVDKYAPSACSHRVLSHPQCR